MASATKAETLQELAGRTHFHGIAFARAGTAKLIIASHHGLFAVVADGTVTQVSPTQDFMGFAPDPSDPLTYFASGHPATGGNSGFLRSRDGGANWAQLSEGAGGPVDFHQMAVSDTTPAIIYGAYGDIQMSADGGSTWTVTGTAPDRMISLEASSLDADRLYAATEGGLLQSENGGKSWQPIAFEGEVVSTVAAAPTGMLFAFVLGQGLMLANEQSVGQWSAIFNGFGQSIPLHIAVDDSDPLHLALTTQNSEVYESVDGGTNWKFFGT